MALKIPIPGIDFSINNPKESESLAVKIESPPPARPAVQASKEALAKEQVSAIEAEALSLGWTNEQLSELTNILRIYMPNCKIGEIRLRAIQLIHLYSDGTIRSYANFYNMKVLQPWLKEVTQWHKTIKSK